MAIFAAVILLSYQAPRGDQGAVPAISDALLDVLLEEDGAGARWRGVANRLLVISELSPGGGFGSIPVPVVTCILLGPTASPSNQKDRRRRRRTLRIPMREPDGGRRVRIGWGTSRRVIQGDSRGRARKRIRCLTTSDVEDAGGATTR